MITREGADRAIVPGPDELSDAVSVLEPAIVFDPLGDGFVQPVLDSLAARGRLVSFGTCAGADVQLNMQTLERKMISVLGRGAGCSPPPSVAPDRRRPSRRSALATSTWWLAMPCGSIRSTRRSSSSSSRRCAGSSSGCLTGGPARGERPLGRG